MRVIFHRQRMQIKVVLGSFIFLQGVVKRVFFTYFFYLRNYRFGFQTAICIFYITRIILIQLMPIIDKVQTKILYSIGISPADNPGLLGAN